MWRKSTHLSISAISHAVSYRELTECALAIHTLSDPTHVIWTQA